MVQYVALLRGIAPMNPNMRNEKLRAVFDKLGFSNIKTVISSGNVIFESQSTDVRKLENMIEQAFPKELGFTSTTIIRSKKQIEKLLQENPFKGMEHSQKTSLNVTFLKNKVKIDMEFPFTPENKTYTFLAGHDDVICSVVDLTGDRTPDLMLFLEKKFGKEITTRSWKTVERIQKAMDS